jgi:hypothetical protein
MRAEKDVSDPFLFFMESNSPYPSVRVRPDAERAWSEEGSFFTENLKAMEAGVPCQAPNV